MRARQRDRVGLKAQTRQGLVERSEARDAIGVERPIEFRRAIVIRQRHAQRFERKQQIAEQDGGVEIEIADRAHRHFRGELRLAAQILETMLLAQRLIRPVVPAGLPHQPDRRDVLRLAGQRAPEGVRYFELAAH